MPWVHQTVGVLPPFYSHASSSQCQCYSFHGKRFVLRRNPRQWIFCPQSKTIHGAQCFTGHRNCQPLAPILYLGCLDSAWTTCHVILLVLSVHEGTQDVSWQEYHTVVRRQALAKQELPELLLSHSQPETWIWGKIFAWKDYFFRSYFEGAGCGRVLLCKLSIHGKSKGSFLAQGIIQCCKDWESSVYKCSTNKTHIFYSHELILSMIKSGNSTLNDFTYIIGLCSCYHFF